MTTTSKTEAYKGSFLHFVALIWGHLGLPRPTKVQKDISKYLQDGPRRRIIMAFRGVGKSWLTAAYVCWLLLRDPQHKIMVVSANEDRAIQFSIFVKRLISDVPLLRHLRTKTGQRDSNLAFDVGPADNDQSPSVKSVGITGQLTGSRADTIIADDVEVPKNSLTQVQRDRIAELVKEFDAVLKPGGQIVYLGTPQTEMSLYNRLIERGYDVRIWPARIPAATKLQAYGKRLAQFVVRRINHGWKPGRPLDPDRFDEADLAEREASYGKAGFALQFMLDTSLSDEEKYPLKLRDFIVMDVPREHAPTRVEWASGPQQVISDLPVVGLAGDRWHAPMYVSKDFKPYQGSVMIVDPAGRGADETGVAVSKALHGTIYVPYVGGYRDGYSEATLDSLGRLALDHGVTLIKVEDNFGDGMFVELLKPALRKLGYKGAIEGYRSSGRKEIRMIEHMEPALRQHRVVIDPEVIRQDYQVPEPKYQLCYQLTRLTAEKGSLLHDDRLEALTESVYHWVRSLAQDAEAQEQQARSKALKDELLKFQKAAGASSPGGRSFLRRYDASR